MGCQFPFSLLDVKLLATDGLFTKELAETVKSGIGQLFSGLGLVNTGGGNRGGSLVFHGIQPGQNLPLPHPVPFTDLEHTDNAGNACRYNRAGSGAYRTDHIQHLRYGSSPDCFQGNSLDQNRRAFLVLVRFMLVCASAANKCNCQQNCHNRHLIDHLSISLRNVPEL